MTKAQQLGIKQFPYEEFDSNGNILYFEESNNYWNKYDYDSNGNLIYYENSSGYGCFKYYDGNKYIKPIREDFKSHYINYKRNLVLNTLLND